MQRNVRLLNEIKVKQKMKEIERLSTQLKYNYLISPYTK